MYMYIVFDCETLYLSLYANKSIPYSRKFSLDKYFAKPSNICITEIFSGMNFHQCGVGCHILYVIMH